MDPSGVVARALTLGGLSLIAPLLLGGAPSWAQATLCALVALAALQLARARQRGKGARLSSPLTLWLAGPLISLTGALISLIPLRWLHPHLSPEGALTLNQLTDPLSAAKLNAPLWGGLSLTPAETLSWVCLQAAFCLTAYLAYHLHPHRLRALTGIALTGSALTLYGLLHDTLGLRALYGIYESTDREALRGFFTPIINPNSAASLMLLSALTALGLAYTQRRAWALCAALSLVGIWRCESRGALIAVSAALALLSYLHPPHLTALTERKARLLTLLGALTALTSAAWWAGVTHTAQEGARSWLTPTPYPRFIVWGDALPIAQERWLSGVGRGAFGEVFTRYQSFSHRQWISHIESHPLEQLIEGGALGLIGGALLPALAWITWRVRARGESHPTATALWIGVGAVGLHQCLDFGLNQAGLALPLAVAWGVMWSYLTAQSHQSQERSSSARSSSARPSSSQRAKRKRRATTALCLAAVALLALTALTLHTSPLHLRPTLSALTATHDPAARAQSAREALGLHPMSAHITQEVALGYATALGLWEPTPHLHREPHLESGAHGKDSSEPPQAEARAEAQAEALYLWTQATKRRAPRFITPHLIEARGYAQEGLSDLATLSYLHAINLAPWHLTQLIREARAVSATPLDLTPLHPELITPTLEALRRAHNNQDALKSLTLLPITQRLATPALRGAQLSLARGQCDPLSISALRELARGALNPNEPCALTFDRALASLLSARCDLGSPLWPGLIHTPLADEQILEIFNQHIFNQNTSASALREALNGCAPGRPGHDTLAWRRLQERLGRVLR